MKYTIIAFFLSLFIALAAKSNLVTPEVYGVKFNEIYLCQSASCDNAVKIGGGDRIDIADPFFTNSVGSLVDLTNAFNLQHKKAYTFIVLSIFIVIPFIPNLYT